MYDHFEAVKGRNEVSPRSVQSENNLPYQHRYTSSRVNVNVICGNRSTKLDCAASTQSFHVEYTSTNVRIRDKSV